MIKPNEVSSDELETGVQYVLEYVGVPYIWGGNNPNGFDCSGLVGEFLKALDLLGARDDLTAQQIYDRFKDFETTEYKRGSIIFYGKDKENIEHVEILVNSRYALGATGGTSITTSVQDAHRVNAFVKIRPIGRRQSVAVIKIGG